MENNSQTVKPVVLIPAYKPEQVLAQIVRNLLESELIQAVIVVNDGSGSEYDNIFKAVSEIKGAYLFRHIVNLGKGAALKTGMNAAACIFSESIGIVTADADGQHSTEDILLVSQTLREHPEHLVMGVRAFDGTVPLRSRFGNIVTRHALRLITGQNISDTQTGLRGIPMKMVPHLLRLSSNGYEFELDMLLTCKYMNLKIIQSGISTIYINNNRSSHFDPLFDSMRIYFVLLRFSLSSVIAAVIDNLVFALFFLSFQNIAGSQVMGRISGAFFNYFANKKLVFQSGEKEIHTMPKYILLVIVSGILSYSLLIFIHSMTGADIVSAKIISEIIIFFFNFVVQRDYVFFKTEQQLE